MLTIKVLDKQMEEQAKQFFVAVFSKEPWNDDWSDKEQLDKYIKELVEQDHSLVFGLFDGEEMVGLSMGYAFHWYSGTEYYIKELCIKTEAQGRGLGTRFLGLMEKALVEKGIHQIFLQTDRNVPACDFYKKNGFFECEDIVSLAKRF